MPVLEGEGVLQAFLCCSSNEKRQQAHEGAGEPSSRGDTRDISFASCRRKFAAIFIKDENYEAPTANKVGIRPLDSITLPMMCDESWRCPFRCPALVCSSFFSPSFLGYVFLGFTLIVFLVYVFFRLPLGNQIVELKGHPQHSDCFPFCKN